MTPIARGAIAVNRELITLFWDIERQIVMLKLFNPLEELWVVDDGFHVLYGEDWVAGASLLENKVIVAANELESHELN